VTCTRGELGEIVVDELDTRSNHRRLGEIRAGELEDAMLELGVTEWENLGYRDSGMMGTPGNRDPRSFWQADLDEAIGRLTFLVRRYRPDVITTYNEFGGYGHPDHIRTHLVALGAWERAGDPAWYPAQFEGDQGLETWTPAKLYEQAIPASVREAMTTALEEMGQKSWWSRPDDATPDELAEWESMTTRMLVPDESITTWVDVSDHLEAKWRALRRHVTQIGQDNPIFALGLEGWRRFWAREAYIIRAARIATSLPETDLFAGLTTPTA
jgi:N-acetyl-1-D-myo-inositol-2-amino-2-deoxy-alpha-D-glucopyranoside deacetylase